MLRGGLSFGPNPVLCMGSKLTTQTAYPHLPQSRGGETRYVFMSKDYPCSGQMASKSDPGIEYPKDEVNVDDIPF